MYFYKNPKIMNEENQLTEPIKSDSKGVEYIYDSYFQQSNNISHRTDWFLIFHAILFEAFFAAGHYEC